MFGQNGAHVTLEGNLFYKQFTIRHKSSKYFISGMYVFHFSNLGNMYL